MRLYRHSKYWLCMLLGTFAIYHDAQWAAVALFVIAALQPVIDTWSPQ
jgi:hypothetical protein